MPPYNVDFQLNYTMKSPLLLLFFCTAFAVSQGQDLGKKKTPLFVSHLSAENSALLRRKAAPKHTVFSKLICFNKKCRSFVGWRQNQRSIRFKGYKKGGGLPTPRTKPPVMKDTTLASQQIVSAPPTQQKNGNEARGQLFVLDEVLFEHNSARLNEALTYRLDSLVDMIWRNKTADVKITGHTDNIGSADHNMKLSTERAQSVAEYLLESGVDEKRISFVGMGSTKPVASNDTDKGRAKNRRVEILLSTQ
jgi:outer membrane protein OmpA-like peptidoglycan-associated protein